MDTMNNQKPEVGRIASDPIRGPLGHLTVVDLTQHLAGPFASQILGDLGARIIKVEPPTGDQTRQVGPYFIGDDSLYFLSVNRNKESVCLNLKTAEGKAALLALVAHADIVLENFRPGTLERLGIDVPVLQEANPKVVVCSISGFGQDGPYRDRPAFDMIVQALSGGMSLTGEPDGLPVRSGLPIGDLCAGMYAVIGVLAGLARLSADGRGSYVDVAMLDTQISLLGYVATYSLTGGAVPGRQGRGHMSIPTYRALICADGLELVIAANTERMWPGLCMALGTPEFIDDKRFVNNDARRQHRDVLDELLDDAARRWTMDDLLARLREAGIPCAPLNTVEAALEDPQVAHRDMILDLPYGEETVKAVGNPVKMSDGRNSHVTPPGLGEHTEEILSSLLGMSSERIETLASTGAIYLAPKPEEPPQLIKRSTDREAVGVTAVETI